MSIKKRLRVILAALLQEWHDKRCAECGLSYLAVGPETQLIAICDRCEVEQMERFTAEMNRRYEQQMRGAI